jgi:NAD(P)-dependent dehydrogenase (short-subunit alcohol dehydrogenase family)
MTTDREDWRLAAGSSSANEFRVSVHAADRGAQVTLAAEILQGPNGLPIVEYRADAPVEGDPPRTVLCFAGGGSSGTLFGLLAQTCAPRGVRIVAFDMPGHTANGLLDVRTPPREHLGRCNAKVRRSVAAAMVARWADQPGRLDLLSHSAGIIDVAKVDPGWNKRIERFVIIGAGIPGLGALRAAHNAAARVDAVSPQSLWSILRSRQIRTGEPEVHFGQLVDRGTPDALLVRHQGPEHIGAVLPLLTSWAVMRAPWHDRQVVLIGSAGDAVSPPDLVCAAEPRLAGRGARVRTHIIAEPLPHMFMCFSAGAAAITEILTDAR